MSISLASEALACIRPMLEDLVHFELTINIESKQAAQ
jgi:hypothetical protein